MNETVPVGEPVAKDATHLHFGKGQTEAVLNLAKGEHVLILQFADGHYISCGETWSQTIRVSVNYKEEGASFSRC